MGGGGRRLVRQVKTAKPSIYHFHFVTRQCSELDRKPEKVKYKDGKTLSAILIRKTYILNQIEKQNYHIVIFIHKKGRQML